MPLYTSIEIYEAFKLPEKGEQATDGLIFFLREIDYEQYLTKLITENPGYWVVKHYYKSEVVILEHEHFIKHYKSYYV